MSQDRWTAVDDYLAGLFPSPDAALDAALAAMAEAGLPAINVTPAQGRLLHILARVQGARRILEIGTLGGYSAIWMASALPPDGQMVTLEADPHHADVARANLERAGLSDRVTIRLGAALDTLPQLAAEGAGPFDLVFIDADKPNTTNYFAWALRLTRPGSLILTDNVVRDGGIADPASTDPSVQAMRAFLPALAAEPRVTATVIQMVGSKGYDGMAFAVVNGEAG